MVALLRLLTIATSVCIVNIFEMLALEQRRRQFVAFAFFKLFLVVYVIIETEYYKDC